MKFINRANELKKLNKLWDEKAAQLLVIHGKRRVGKTELIKQFIKDGKGIYFLADKRTHKEQLSEFARVVGNYFDDDFVSKKGFSDWLEAFLYLKEKSKSQRFVVALDEYPYLVETDAATSSLFQKIWDEYIKETNIYLILCGSSMSIMESELLSYKAQLYGRLTGQLLIEPMDYLASQKFFPNKSFEEFMSFYSVTGGMPAYMEQFAKYGSAVEAVEELCWDKQGLYHNEVNNVLKQELRTPNNYFAILKAISWGKTQPSEIANSTGLDAQLVNKYMETLINLQFVKREVPVTEDKPHKSRKGLYILTESFVRFWFQYVYAFNSDLEIGNITQTKKRFAKHSHVLEEVVFEQVSRDFILHNQKLLFPLDSFGRYWDSQTEIDGLGFNHELKRAVFLEAKWSNSKMADTELTKLYAKAASLKEFEEYEKYFVLSNKAGFHQKLIDRSKENNQLILLEQLGVVV
ncbi:MAG: ATP-binding protein [Candidatus Pacebacteria bacterium]|nr:ATP-binding protein [Candidatus Paceibacterota bacterium]